MICFALAKGRLAEESAALLEKCGIDTSVLKEDTRKLILTSADGGYRFFLVKPSDVPTYVEAGVADLGIAGKDTLMEQDKDLYEMLDLKIGECRLCIAGAPGRRDALTNPHLRVATKYVNTARRVFAERDEEAEIILESGIFPSDRAMVHLSRGYRDAVRAGSVRTEDPVILVIDTGVCMELGSDIGRAAKTVYLCRSVPADAIDIADPEDWDSDEEDE